MFGWRVCVLTTDDAVSCSLVGGQFDVAAPVVSVRTGLWRCYHKVHCHRVVCDHATADRSEPHLVRTRPRSDPTQVAEAAHALPEHF